MPKAQVANRFFLAILICFLLRINVGFCAESMHFEHLAADDGLSIGFISDIVRDNQGFMWFAGSEGLARFDGYDYRIYRHDINDINSLDSNMVWSIAIDKQGVLWVRTSSGLCRYNGTLDNFTRLAHLHAASDIRVGPLVVDHDGNLWVTTSEGMARYNHETETLVSVKQAVGFDDANQAMQAEDGSFWLSSPSQGLIRWDAAEDVVEIYRHDPNNPSSMVKSQVQALYELRDGRILIGTLDGLSMFDPKLGYFIHFRHIEGEINSLGSNIVMDIEQDKREKVWLATDGGGLNLFDLQSQTFTQIKHDGFFKSSLSSNVIKSIYKDPHGDLWLGMYPSGVDYFNRLTSSFASYRNHPLKRYSLSNNDVGTICEDKLGNLWLGTGGGLNYFDRREHKFYNINNEPKDPGTLRDWPVMKVYCDSKHRLWAAVWGGGLYRLDEGASEFVHYKPRENSSSSIAHSNIWGMMEDKRGVMWFGTENGLSRYDEVNDNFFSYQHDPKDSNSLPNNHVWTVSQDSRGYIWVGTLGGLTQFNPVKNSFKNFSQKANDSTSLPANTVFVVFEDSKRRLWVGSAGNLSLFDREHETFSHFAGKIEFASTIVRGILEDDEGYLWVSGPKGIARFNPDTLETQIFNRSNGLQGNEFSFGAVKTKAGELVFGGRRGFNIISDIYEVQRNDIIPKVRFTALSISNKPVSIGVPGSPLKKAINHSEELTFTADQALVSFKFAALSYRNRHKNQYAYMLEGFDDDWYNIGTERVATYTNLDAGKYTLMVKSSNDEGRWSDEATELDIRVLPPWYKTWWAYMIYTLLVLGQISGILYSQYRRRLQAEQLSETLETKVQQRTAQLQAKTQDINNMLQNMHQGIFTIDSDLNIHSEYSRYLETILDNRNLAGAPIISTIFEDSDISKDECSQVESALHSCFIAEKGLWDINKHLLVSEVIKTVDGEDKVLELDWDPLLGADGRVEKMLITVRDVTSIRLLQREADEQRQELEMVGHILALPPKTFDDFYQSTNLMLENSRQILKEQESLESEGINVLRRNLHTIKGNARTLGLSYLTNAAHELEDHMDMLLGKKRSVRSRPLLTGVGTIRDVLHHYYEIYDEKLVHYNQSTDGGVVQLEETLEAILAAAKSHDTQKVIELVNKQQVVSFGECLEPIILGATNTAAQLNKLCPEIKVDAYGVMVMRVLVASLRDVFTHIVTNAIDHGIEPAEVREECGKSPAGLINIVARQEDGVIIIRVWDDGQGLAIDKLRARFKDFNSDAQEVANRIFESGVSTADTVGVVSGRGVGLDTAAAYLQELNGTIKIQFTADSFGGHQPFEFVIRLPVSLDI